ncbi:hypothetical protein BZA77DRAFT_240289 [Pyronema omphalodes]|nr:hypothetical protein BZA77DRAFT_240289 [Pyronema omphalodes]
MSSKKAKANIIATSPPISVAPNNGTSSTSQSSFESSRERYYPFGSGRITKRPKFLINQQSKTTESKSWISSLKSRFFHHSKFKFGSDKTFEKICFELGRADSEEVGKEACQIFDSVELDLKINTVGKTYTLVVPPPIGAAGLGDEEEQGSGGSCDQFIGSLPESCRNVSEKASPLGLVPKLLPHGIISKEARYVGSCFWIWLCIVDDLTENLVGKAWDDCERDLFLAFARDVDESLFHDKEHDAVRVSLALRNVIHSTNICGAIVDSRKEIEWRQSFMDAVCEVLVAFREERPLLSSDTISMADWMRLRAITISVRPFLILARTDLGLSPAVSALGNPLSPEYEYILASNDDTKVSCLRKVECMLQIIMGLQNDILGWEKDFKQKNPLSAIQVLIANGSKHSSAIGRVVNAHNELVRRCIQHAQLVCDEPDEILDRLDYDGIEYMTTETKGSFIRTSIFGIFRQSSLRSSQRRTDKENIRTYVTLILGFANGMANWMAVSKRYAS